MTLTATYVATQTFSIAALRREGLTVYRLVLDGQETPTTFPTLDEAETFCSHYNRFALTRPLVDAFDAALEATYRAEWADQG